MKDKFDKLGKYKITLIKWNDEWGHWRMWIDNRNDDKDSDDDESEFICEKPTVEECLDSAIAYINKK